MLYIDFKNFINKEYNLYSSTGEVKDDGETQFAYYTSESDYYTQGGNITDETSK